MRGLAAALAVGLTATAALAQQDGTELAPSSAPTPEARPSEEGLTEPLVADQAGPDAAPSPEPRPEEDERADQTDAPAADGTASPPVSDNDADSSPSLELEPATPPVREVLAETEEELTACLAELDALGAIYERADPVTDPETPDCGIANPLTLSRIAARVAVEPPATLRCAAALAGARWVTDAVLPFSRKLGDRGPLVAVDNGTAYLCRPREDGGTSEHAYGNALDIMGFRFEKGDPIPVQPRGGDGTIEEAFQRAVRSAACLDFTTVLGPGSDADHADHLHLDVKARENGFRICQ